MSHPCARLSCQRLARVLALADGIARGVVLADLVDGRDSVLTVVRNRPRPITAPISDDSVGRAGRHYRA